MIFYQFNLVHLVSPAPNTPPRNFEGNATSSRSISLAWDPPLFEDQNGVIISYAINVTLLETGEKFQLSTDAHSLILDSLRPFGTYSFIIAAETVVSEGPFSTVLTIATPEDSKLHHYVILNDIKSWLSRALTLAIFSFFSSI